MTAVAKLDAMKRIAAFVAVRKKMAGTDPEVITESNGVPLLMSDLRATLSPAELGGVEAVVGELRCDNEGGRTIKWRDGFHDVSGRTFFIVGTTPRAAEAVTEEIVSYEPLTADSNTLIRVVDSGDRR